MLPVSDLSESELVLAWNERRCPPLLETFVTLCERVAQSSAIVASSSADSAGSENIAQ
jgi:hypothetical protein